MSKRIFLLRHAQSAGKQAGQRDYDRWLTPEGEELARKTGFLFMRNSIRPQFILSSSAARAKATAEKVNEYLHLSPSNLSFHEELYEALPDTWIERIKQLPDPINNVLCVGHNPVISGLASQFGKHLIDLPPAGLALFESAATSWPEFDNQLKEINLSLSTYDHGR